ncbi:MAG: LysM peptidoglycan-binding domain-containing protein [Clostridia bacterium]|nr:LysM peptidoglycan-binding domain-containing protein [Clostridia bacterium]
MKIHTTSAGEGLKEIAELYEVSEENIRNVNELSNSQPALGEELLIIKPTRTYRVQFGDTPERIALRFGVRKEELFQNNPWIIGRTLKEGEELTLKASEKPCGMAVSNGYFYKDCSGEKLIRAMPYLTYVTFASAIADDRGIRRIFNDKTFVEMALKKRKIPLVRIYDKATDRYKSDKDLSEIAKKMIDFATNGGYKGIVLNSCSSSDSAQNYSLFLVALRKMMIGCDLILVTEIGENSPLEFSEYADGSVIYYPKFANDNAPSFNDGERKLLSDFACSGESAKVFIDLPSLACLGKDFCSISDALSAARLNGYQISKNENTLLSSFNDRRQGEVRFSSMEYLKRIFDLIDVFDYMGICFDIMRAPLHQIMMYNALFKTSYMNGVRTREGCSRGVEE